MTLTIKRSLAFAFVSVMLLTACKKDKVKGPVPADDYVETTPAIQAGVAVKINNAIGGFYAALPSYYSQTTKSYPLLVSIHGAGQSGNGNTQLPFLLNDGVAKVIAEKRFPPNFVVNGKNYAFIVLSPQFSKYPGVTEVESFIQYAKKKYRIDASRIYLTGLSMGGYVSSDMGAAYPKELAAIVPMAGVSETGDLKAKAAAIAKNNLPAWYFNNNNDPSVPVSNVTHFVTLINDNNPAIKPKTTIFDGVGHDCWTKATDPDYKENGMNIYEWMLQYKR
ncbi:MAG: alpha/beta hydrolase [Williamsia sp.]|nr:alpha/beta hydrolase [Williamsia sp.]